MRLHHCYKPTAAVLAAVAVPLPLHGAGHRRHPRVDPAHHHASHARHHPRRHPADARARQSPAPAAGRASTQAAHPRSHGASNPRARRHRVFHLSVATAAGDPGDAISNFRFNPASLTIHVGDTVTWTNQDSVQHTATANNHSFDTGLLKKGQSASHTFSAAGTFTYFCAVHPYMKGTVVVLAATGGTPSSGSSTGSSSGSNSGSSSGSNTGSNPSANANTNPASSSTGGNPAGTTSSGSSGGASLPNTGLDVGLTLLCGLSLLAGGLVLRRPARARRRRRPGSAP